MISLTNKNLLNFLEIDHFYEGSLFKIYGKCFIKNNNYIYIFRVTKMNCTFLSKMRSLLQIANFNVYFLKENYLLAFLKCLFLFYIFKIKKNKYLLKQEEKRMLIKFNDNISNGSFFFTELLNLQQFFIFQTLLLKDFSNDIIPWYIKTGSQFLTYELFINYLNLIPKNNSNLIYFFFFRIFFFYKILLYLINFLKLENIFFHKINF